MYISNTTKQNHRHNFRIPEQRRILVLDIPSGRQVQVGQDWNVQQIEAVVAHLERFGARPSNSAAGKLKNYSGILYSLDKPIVTDRIEAAHEVVVDEQTKRSADELTKGALGFDAALRDKRTRKRGARSTTLQISEDVPPHTKPTGKEVKFGLTVSPEGKDNPGVD